jgi:hypothetical protein
MGGIELDKRIGIGIAAVVIILLVGGSLLYVAYYNSFYAIDRANALFSRAETAGFAEDMIAYLQRGRQLLPKSGNPVWWFPTDKTNFSEIHKDIDGIIARAILLESLQRDSPAYQNGMDDLRGKIRALELQVAEASGYMFVSGSNVVTSTIWLAAFAIIAFMLKRR